MVLWAWHNTQAARCLACKGGWHGVGVCGIVPLCMATGIAYAVIGHLPVWYAVGCFLPSIDVAWHKAMLGVARRSGTTPATHHHLHAFYLDIIPNFLLTR
ncbi:hypothetical protein HAX54_051127 [Datura stramonium]|uniref:Uncharacterized protein n=1 Tax=Datura stramonium TaxID=4076 RepID=A0ABS8WP73_DATST|nr:hypothetical protein [Datura stramonium]